MSHLLASLPKMGVLPNSIYASEAFLPISFRAADFLQIYVPFVVNSDAP
jgi:hypothetical protein